MTPECLKLPDFSDWWFLDVITMSWLSASELLARMAQFVHGFQYPCPLAVPSHVDSGLSLVTCFGQWDNSIYDMSRNLKSACASGLVLLVPLKSCHQAQASLLED